MNQSYIDSARLMLAVAPVVFRQPAFALKGGTAINLFLRDMPRPFFPYLHAFARVCIPIGCEDAALSRISLKTPISTP